MNYGELKTTVTRYLKRKDLVDLYPTWAEFAGRRIDAEMRLPEQEYRTTAVPQSEYFALPLDYLEMRKIQYDGYPMEQLSPVQIAEISQQNLNGRPRYYCVMDNQVQLLPAPADDDTRVLELFYYARNPILQQDSQFNAVLLTYPQLYVYGMLVEAMPFLEHVQGQATWAQMFTDYASAVNEGAKRARHAGNGLVMR